ncbi:CPS-53 (KpLE1) prophage protein [Escherichia coli]|nr:CPS-53 (KpLE1) prophage protein [Escherichia coli]
MASERSTDVQAFIGELDGGVFETKIGAVLSEVASGVMNTKTKGKVSLNLEIEPFDENRVKIKHKLSYVRPTTIDEPGHADNTATLKLKKTAPFSALLSVNGERNSQKSLAEWIEDWADYLVGFDANGDTIQATKAAAAVRKITIEANQTADFEDNDFSGKRSLMESVEAKTKDIMPVAFEFKCVPFEGLKERPFKLRLSIITGDRPVLVLRIIQLEAMQEEMANEFRDLLVEKFKDSKVETFIGTFTA